MQDLTTRDKEHVALAVSVAMAKLQNALHEIEAADIILDRPPIPEAAVADVFESLRAARRPVLEAIARLAKLSKHLNN